MKDIQKPRKALIKELKGYEICLEGDSYNYYAETFEQAEQIAMRIEAEERTRVEKENDEELNTIAENKRLRYQMERYLKDRSFTTKEDRAFLRHILRESGIDTRVS